MNDAILSKRFIGPAALALSLSAAGLGGCAGHAGTHAALQGPVAEPVRTAAAADRPAFGVGDELGWMAFGDLALAPLPGEPTHVLVIALADQEADDTPAFDWVGRYLALAR